MFTEVVEKFEEIVDRSTGKVSSTADGNLIDAIQAVLELSPFCILALCDDSIVIAESGDNDIASTLDTLSEGLEMFLLSSDFLEIQTCVDDDVLAHKHIEIQNAVLSTYFIYILLAAPILLQALWF
jgi:hypothetical protein